MTEPIEQFDAWFQNLPSQGRGDQHAILPKAVYVMVHEGTHDAPYVRTLVTQAVDRRRWRATGDR